MLLLWIALLGGNPAMGDPPPAGQRPAARPFGFDAVPHAGNCGVVPIEPGKPVPERLLLAARSTPNQVRILLSTDRTTMDFRPDRLTIIIDPNGVVLSTRCG